VLPFPFHFQNNSQAMNVRPLNYEWIEFYDNVIDLTKYTFSWAAIARRVRGTKRSFATWLNVVRAISSEGFGRIKYYTAVRDALKSDLSMRRFFEGETQEVPSFYVERVRRELGPFWEWLPEGALNHDPNAYLKKIGGEARRQDPAIDTEPAAAAASG
jgi:hypothetical protein